MNTRNTEASNVGPKCVKAERSKKERRGGGKRIVENMGGPEGSKNMAPGRIQEREYRHAGGTEKTYRVLVARVRRGRLPPQSL